MIVVRAREAGGRITGCGLIGARYDVNMARPLVSLTQAAIQVARQWLEGPLPAILARTPSAQARSPGGKAAGQNEPGAHRRQADKQSAARRCHCLEQGRQLHVDQVQLRWQIAGGLSRRPARYQQGS